MSTTLFGRLGDIGRSLGDRAYAAADRVLTRAEEKNADILEIYGNDNSEESVSSEPVDIGHVDATQSNDDADAVDAIIEE